MKKAIIAGLIVFVAAIGSGRAAEAKDNWAKGCVKCHGEDGKGETKMGKKIGLKSFTEASVQASFKDEEAFQAVKEGLKDKDGKLLMKPAEGVSDEEIKALVQYVRAFKK